MIYEYRCLACKHAFDVVKSVRDIDCNENCPKCGEFAERAFAPSRIHIVGAKVEDAEYNPGLGKVVKNKKHRAELAKQMGLEEVGNEKPETIHKHFDQAREDKRERVWKEADKGWVGDGSS